MTSQDTANSAPSKKATHVLLIIIVAILAALLVYVLITSAPSLKHETMKRQAAKIETLPAEQQAAARETLLASIDEQLVSGSERSRTKMAELGVQIAQQSSDEPRQFRYYEYLNTHDALTKEQSITYAQLLFKVEQTISSKLQVQIDRVFAQHPKQGDMMVIIGEHSLNKKHYYLAVKAFDFAIKDLTGDALTHAEALRKTAQKELDALLK